MTRDFWGELQDLHSDLEEVVLDGNPLGLGSSRIVLLCMGGNSK